MALATEDPNSDAVWREVSATETEKKREVLEMELERLGGFELVRCFEEVLHDAVSAAECEALQQQGRVIMAAISGQLTAFPGCVPYWHNRPEGS